MSEVLRGRLFDPLGSLPIRCKSFPDGSIVPNVPTVVKEFIFMGEFINSKQMRFDKSLVSCGVMEAHHIPKASASKNVFAIATAMYHKANPRPCAFVLFSDVVDSEEKRGVYLAQAITTLFGVEALWASPIEVNPRSGNKIRVWLWHLDHDKIRKWYQDELANRVDD